MKCIRCEDAQWVCENHPEQPYPCVKCDGAGMPCPDCNAGDDEHAALRLPDGFKPDVVRDDDDDATRH
jgi:hypothetical protein